MFHTYVKSCLKNELSLKTDLNIELFAVLINMSKLKLLMCQKISFNFIIVKKHCFIAFSSHTTCMSGISG